MRVPAFLTLLIAAALIFAACGGPKDSDKALTEACERQHKEIEEMAHESGTPTAKSTEEAMDSEDLVECAGQKPKEPKADMVDADEAPAKGTKPVELDPAARELFLGKCGSCHVLSDAGSEGAVGPNLDETKLTAAQIEQQIINGKGAMPGGLLTGDDATAVAEYVAGASAQD